MGQYDDKCHVCNDGLVRVNGEEKTCAACGGYGYLLTPKGHDLIEFLKRRGVYVSISPLAEEELRGMIE
jgi:hypothetical protein